MVSRGFSEPALEIYFFAVGHGDSVFFRFPNGRNLLIDTGNLSWGGRVADRLQSLGVNRVHHLIVTHPHPDHVGGVFALSARLPVERMYDNGLPWDHEIYYEFRRLKDRTGKTVRTLAENNRIEEGEVSVQILHPDPKRTLSGLNDNSVVAQIRFGSFVGLFTGDLLIEGQDLLIEKFGTKLDSDLFKAPHHASSAANGPSFFKIVSPEVSVVTVGPNPYGYPSEETLENLAAHSGKVYRTDRDGTIRVKAFSDKRMEIETGK